MDVNIRGDLLTESFIEFRIAIEFQAERNYDYDIHSLTHSLTHSDYLERGLFVKVFFYNLIKTKENSLMQRVSGFFFAFLKKEGVWA